MILAIAAPSPPAGFRPHSTPSRPSMTGSPLVGSAQRASSHALRHATGTKARTYSGKSVRATRDSYVAHAYIEGQTGMDGPLLVPLDRLRLRTWAHTLGFPGHWLAKSRAYSTTFGALLA